MMQELGIIIHNRLLAYKTYEIKIKAEIATSLQPGQFVNIKIQGFLLRRPISICSIVDNSHFVMIYKVVGEGTKKLATLTAQEQVNIIGPLGSSFPIINTLNAVLLIGGGAGVPPLYEVAKRYRTLSKKVYVVMGFQSEKEVFYEKAFTALGCCVHVATMDGSYGICGTAIDVIEKKKICEDFIYSCGPMGMLKAVEKKYTKGFISFESRMACGIGACLACVVKDKKMQDVYHRICKEGPVFAIGKVEI